VAGVGVEAEPSAPALVYDLVIATEVNSRVECPILIGVAIALPELDFVAVLAAAV